MAETALSPVVVLPCPALYQDMHACPNCGGEQIWIPVYEFEGGRVGYCLGCGEEKVQWFTRVTA